MKVCHLYISPGHNYFGHHGEPPGNFFGTAHCAPCHWMNEAFAPGAEHFLQNRGGLRAQILSDGKLRLEK
ncbi:MAG TPA: hypothetical protein VFB55_08705 [Verrucomicrobiae bacterium]|nr:hypothetical protein [Verrucomicrobiae bacterium]